MSVSFDGAPPAASTPIPRDVYYARVRDSKAGRSALPLNVEESAVAPKASPGSTQVVVNTYYRPRRSSESYSVRENEEAPSFSTREGNLDPAPVTSRASFRSRSRNRSGITLVPFAGASYTQNDVQGTLTEGSTGYSSTTDISGKTGFSLGVLADLGDSQFTIQTGIVYIQEGAAIRISGRDYYNDPYSVDAKLTAHFVGVPLLLKMNTGSPGEFRFTLKGGIVPVYATNIDLETKSQYIDGYGMAQSSRYSGSSDTDLRRFNVLGQLGAGLVLPLDDTIDLRFEALYNRSFMTLSAGNSQENMYTQSYTGLLGMGFHL